MVLLVGHQRMRVEANATDANYHKLEDTRPQTILIELLCYSLKLFSAVLQDVVVVVFDRKKGEL